MEKVMSALIFKILIVKVNIVKTFRFTQEMTACCKGLKQIKEKTRVSGADYDIYLPVGKCG